MKFKLSSIDEIVYEKMQELEEARKVYENTPPSYIKDIAKTKVKDLEELLIPHIHRIRDEKIDILMEE